MWQFGTDTVKTLGNASLNNCYFVVVDNINAFPFTFDMLMLGGGVVFNIQKEHVFSLPKVVGAKITNKLTNDADFIVPDIREGWVDLLRKVLVAYFETGEGFSYSTVCVRPAGAPIAGFGGTASGSGPLREGLAKICGILDKRIGKKLRPIDAMDIMNIIGSVVVAGNVRRSAEITLGDHEDTYFLRAKRFDLKEPVPNWRSMSNNTVICNDIDYLPDHFWKTYEVGGEPYGLFNMKVSQTKGRTQDKHRKDPRIQGTNPCGEISLESGEMCNLAEIHMVNIDSVEEFARIQQLIWKVCKVVTLVPHHWPESNEVLQRNRRTGLGLTGVLQKELSIIEEWCNTTYPQLERADEEFSERLTEVLGYKVNPSIKLTTIKPSGTASLLSGASPGAHPDFSEYYIRRIRIASSSPIVEACRKAGYHVEHVLRFDGSRDPGTCVVEFPVKAKEGTTLAKDMTAIDQLEVVKTLQRCWSDNAVSVTIYYRKEELADIRAWLEENYNDHIKAVSFLQHSEHGFAQAPLEEITEKEYERSIRGLKPLDLSSSHDEMYDMDAECSEGSCPIR